MTTTIDNHKNDRYLFWDRVGKISLLFFSGLYFFSTFGPLNWALLISSGIIMILCTIFILYNDYRYEQYGKIKWKFVGGIVTLLMALIVTLYSMYVYSYGLFG